MEVRSDLGRFLTPLLETWSSQGIDYLVLRNYESLPQSLGNDLDVLVRPGQREEAVELLWKVARDNDIRIHHCAEFVPLSLYVSSTHPGGLRLHIDLFDWLGWRGFSVLDAQEVLSRKRHRGSIPVPAPGDEAFLNLLTRLLYVGEVRDKYRPSIRSVAMDGDPVFEANVLDVLGRREGRKLLADVRQGDWVGIARRARSFRFLVAARNLTRQPVSSWRQQVGDAARYYRRVRRPPGLMIVFLGPDGAGKSTLAAALSGRLGHTFYPGMIRRLHWRPGVLPKRAVASESVADPHGQPARSTLGSLPYYAYHLADFVLGRWMIILPSVFRNGLVVFDRYYHDLFVDSGRYRLKLPRFVLNLGRRLVREPDIAFVMTGPVGVLRERKPEVESMRLARQIDEYGELERLLKRARKVDVTRSLSALTDQLEAEVLDLLEKRFSLTARGRALEGARR